jgi:hypothetical protein
MLKIQKSATKVFDLIKKDILMTEGGFGSPTGITTY